MHRVALSVAALASGILLAPKLASALPAATTESSNLRAGPAFDFPVVDRIPSDVRVNVHGCVRAYRWCDVSWRDARGWLPGEQLVYLDNGRRVAIIEYGPRVHLPIIAFSVDRYWDRYYRGRSWYGQRAHWRTVWRGHGDGDGRRTERTRDRRDGDRIGRRTEDRRDRIKQRTERSRETRRHQADQDRRHRQSNRQERSTQRTERSRDNRRHQAEQDRRHRQSNRQERSSIRSDRGSSSGERRAQQPRYRQSEVQGSRQGRSSGPEGGGGRAGRSEGRQDR